MSIMRCITNKFFTSTTRFFILIDVVFYLYNKVFYFKLMPVNLAIAGFYGVLMGHFMRCLHMLQ